MALKLRSCDDAIAISPWVHGCSTITITTIPSMTNVQNRPRKRLRDIIPVVLKSCTYRFDFVQGALGEVASGEEVSLVKFLGAVG